MTRARSLPFPVAGGSLETYIAYPESPAPFPAVLLAHEGLGPSAHLRELAERFAGQGYLAVAPNLYSRQQAYSALDEKDILAAHGLFLSKDRETALSALDPELRDRIRKVLAWFDSRDTSTYSADLQAIAAALRKESFWGVSALGAVGFSLGGGLVGKLAADVSSLDAAAVAYGRLPDPEAADRVAVPVLGLFAEGDEGLVPPIAPFAHSLDRRKIPFTWKIYEARHGFFNPARPSHHPAEAHRAWQDLLGFFDRHLKAGRKVQ